MGYTGRDIIVKCKNLIRFIRFEEQISAHFTFFDLCGMLKMKMQAKRLPTLPATLKSNAHKNVKSTQCEMIIFVGFLDAFCYFFGSLSLIPGSCLFRERAIIKHFEGSASPNGSTKGIQCTYMEETCPS